MYEIQEVGDRHVKLQVKGIMDLYQQSVSVQRCSKRYLLVKTKYHKFLYECLLLYYLFGSRTSLLFCKCFDLFTDPGSAVIS